MTTRLRLAIERLAGLLSPGAAWPRGGQAHALGPFRVVEPGGDPASRGQTIIAIDSRLVLLIDQFQEERKTRRSLALSGARFRGGPLRWQVAAARGKAGWTLHLLGDYGVSLKANTLVMEQMQASGRFLAALTVESGARLRHLNGWSIEVRTADHLLHILHSNPARVARPLGPVVTDARFGLAAMPAADPFLPPSEANLRLLDVSLVRWAGGRELRLHARGDLTCLSGPEP